MIKVEFEIHVIENNNLVIIQEADLLNNFEAHLETLRQANVLEGAINIIDDDIVKISVTDELWYAINNFCFLSIHSVSEGHEACFLYKFFSSDDHVVFIPIANLIRIFGEHQSPLTVFKNDILPKLFNCGGRFIEMLERAGITSSINLQAMLSFMEKARHALVKQNIL